MNSVRERYSNAIQTLFIRTYKGASPARPRSGGGYSLGTVTVSIFPSVTYQMWPSTRR